MGLVLVLILIIDEWYGFGSVLARAAGGSQAGGWGDAISTKGQRVGAVETRGEPGRA